MRRRMLLLVLLVVFGALTPVPGTAAPDRPVTLRVMSYNIHSGIGAGGELDLERTANTIRNSGVDVVALQEVDVHWDARSEFADQARELAGELGMRVFFAPIYDRPGDTPAGPREQFGVAVLSRHPIMRARNHEITRLSTQDPGAEPEAAPGFAEVTVLAHGRPVHVYATHLDFRPDPAVRARQVEDMLRIMGTDGPRARQVLLGDFNATPAAPELAPLFARYGDAWRAAGGDGFTYPADTPESRIDYVTHSAGLAPRAASTLDSKASDHRPVTAELALVPRQARGAQPERAANTMTLSR